MSFFKAFINITGSGDPWKLEVQTVTVALDAFGHAYSAFGTVVDVREHDCLQNELHIDATTFDWQR